MKYTPKYTQTNVKKMDKMIKDSNSKDLQSSKDEETVWHRTD